MVIDVETNGRIRTVTLDPLGEGSRYRIRVGEQTYQVDVRWLDEATVSLVDEERGAVFTVGFAETASPDETLVFVGGAAVVAKVGGRPGARRSGDSGPGPGAQAIVAPMPGRVVRVLVGSGAQVASRQPLVVVEAMKMENELRSPKAGRVTAVTVQEGMSVEAGRVLVVVE